MKGNAKKLAPDGMISILIHSRNLELGTDQGFHLCDSGHMNIVDKNDSLFSHLSHAKKLDWLSHTTGLTTKRKKNQEIIAQNGFDPLSSGL
jgi:hypothetical protein